MKFVRFMGAFWIAVVVMASTALGANTDIQARRTIITDGPACAGSPLEHQPACIKAVVKNLGPDPYVGTGPNKGGNGVIAAGLLSIVVDIDEPTKPGQPSGIATQQFSKSFAVTIAVGDSATLDFGQVGLKLGAGSHAAHMTATAQLPNVDGNGSNNSAVTVFSVFAAPSAAGRTALVVLGLGLATAASVAMRRRVRTSRV